MGYSNDVMLRARRQLENANQAAKAENRRRTDEAYARMPRLKEIDGLLRRSMVLAAQAAFAKGDEAQQIMEDARKANLALQEERRALIARYYPADWLEVDSACARCGGSGYMGSAMCSCLETLCKQEQKKDIGLLTNGLTRFEDFDLSYYPDAAVPGTDISMRAVMTKTLNTCRAYAAAFPGEQGNLLFSGDTGLGKTLMAACIASEVTDKGCSVVYESAAQLFAQLEKAKFAYDPETRAQMENYCSRYTNCDLLILDDLGTELSGQFVTAALYNLINERYLQGKATIISTNLKNEEMESRYSSQILSRLRGNYRRVAFVGQDIRVKKNRGQL